MTIGQLSQRTGVPIKLLREYEALGFLYTQGRSESNYRLFGEETLWCVQVVQGLRSLGLTLREIKELTTPYQERPGESITSIEALLDEKLAQVLARVAARMASLQALRQRILDFQVAQASAPSQPSSAQPTAWELARLLVSDPRHNATASASPSASRPPLTLPPG